MKCVDLLRQNGGWRGNLPNQLRRGSCETRPKAGGRGEENDGREERTLIGAENEVLRAGGDELGIPVTQPRRCRSMWPRFATKLLEERSGTTKRDQSNAGGTVDVI